MSGNTERGFRRRVSEIGGFRFENTRRTRWALSGLGIVLLVGLWQVGTSVFSLDSQYFPSPVDVVTELERIWSPVASVLPNTVTAAVVGYLIALSLSIVLGMVLVANDRLLNALMPFIIGVNTVPRIALTPLVIYWVSFVTLDAVYLANYLMAAWVAFFPMLIAALDGFRNIDERTRNMFSVYGATSWQEFKYVRLRKGLPFVFDGMKTGFILAMIGAVVGEFVSGTPGIGSMADSAIGRISISRAFAIVLLLGLISTAVVLLIYQVERRVIFWQDSSIMGEG